MTSRCEESFPRVAATTPLLSAPPWSGTIADLGAGLNGDQAWRAPIGGCGEGFGDCAGRCRLLRPSVSETQAKVPMKARNAPTITTSAMMSTTDIVPLHLTSRERLGAGETGFVDLHQTVRKLRTAVSS